MLFIQHECMEDKATDARLDVDVERRDLERQIQDLANTQNKLILLDKTAVWGTGSSWWRK